jgi:DNA-directed RNA polymerase specialized sigma24 family protein
MAPVMSDSEPVLPEGGVKKKPRTRSALDTEAFECLLRLLDRDREKAGLRYEDLRRRLTMFFESRSHPDSEHLVDVVMDRVACKLRDGADILPADSVPYTFGVARMIALEEHRRRLTEQTTSLTWDAADPRLEPSERELDCLDHCLGALDSNTRNTVLSYYKGQGSEKLDNRTGIAARLGITHTALANRTWRIRTRLAKCVHKCVEQDS